MQLKQALRTTSGFDAQMQMLSPAAPRSSAPSVRASATDSPDCSGDHDPASPSKENPPQDNPCDVNRIHKAAEGTGRTGVRDVNHIHKAAERGRAGARDVNHLHKTAERGRAGGGSQLPYFDHIQKSFGRHDISGVKSHSGPKASQATQAIGAEAYASGDDVVFGASPDLHTTSHEAAHIIQQRQGISLSGGIGTHGDRFERHADEVADRVVRGESAEALLGDPRADAGSNRQIQKRDGGPPRNSKPSEDLELGGATPIEACQEPVTPEDAQPDRVQRDAGSPQKSEKSVAQILEEPDDFKDAQISVLRAYDATFERSKDAVDTWRRQASDGDPAPEWLTALITVGGTLLLGCVGGVIGYVASKVSKIKNITPFGEVGLRSALATVQLTTSDVTRSAAKEHSESRRGDAFMWAVHTFADQRSGS